MGRKYYSETLNDETVLSPADAELKSESPKKTIIVNAYNVNVRKEADAESEVIGTLRRDTEVEVLESGPRFSRISSPMISGYVKNAFLKDVI